MSQLSVSLFEAVGSLAAQPSPRQADGVVCAPIPTSGGEGAHAERLTASPAGVRKSSYASIVILSRTGMAIKVAFEATPSGPDSECEY